MIEWQRQSGFVRRRKRWCEIMLNEVLIFGHGWNDFVSGQKKKINIYNGPGNGNGNENAGGHLRFN